MRGAPKLWEAAQKELATANKAREAAERARQSAKARLGEASRELARAQSAVDKLSDDAPPTAGSRRLDPTSAKTARGARSARKPGGASLWPAFVGGGIIVVVAVSLWAVNRFPARSGKSAPASSPAVSVTLASPERLAAPLVGNWVARGLTCDQSHKITVAGDTLSMIGAGKVSTFKISPTSRVNAVATSGPEGDFTFRIDQNNGLAVDGPSGPVMQLTRCAS